MKLLLLNLMILPIYAFNFINLVNNYPILHKMPINDNFYEKKKIIDIGCGIGKSTDELCKKFSFSNNKNIEIIGIDKNEINILRANCNYPNYNFFIDDIINSNLPSNEFDILFVKNVFQEIDSKNLEKVIYNLKRISKTKNTVLYINEQNIDENINVLLKNIKVLKTFYNNNNYEIIAKIN